MPNMAIVTSFEKFADHCRKFSALWTSVRFSMLGGHGSKGHQLLGLHATFGNQPFEEPLVETLADVPGQPVAMHGTIAFEEFIRTVGQIDKGELRMRGRAFDCAAFFPPDQLVLRAKGDEYLRSHDLVSGWTRPWPSLFLRKYGPDVSSLGIDELKLNEALRRGRYPYGGLFYFCVDKLGFGVGGATSTQIEVLAPLYIFLVVDLSPTKLSVRVFADTSIPAERFFAKVWHGAYRDGVGRVVEFEDAPIVETCETEGRNLRAVEKSLEMPSSVSQAVVVLILDGEEMEYCSPSIQLRPAVTVPQEERSWADLVIHGPEEGTEDVCFVLMPITGQMKRIFKHAFEPVAAESGLRAEYSDMLASSTVVPEIIKKLHTAKVVLADVTRHRPNVYYEIGLTHKINPNKVIIIGQEPFAELPSDLQQQSPRYIAYEDDEDGLSDLMKQLRKRIQSCLDQRRSEVGGLPS